MTEIPDMTAPEMTRVTVRVPKATLNQIGQWVDSLGVRRSHFLGIALVTGSRLLMRACSPEAFAVARSMQASGGTDWMDDQIANRESEERLLVSPETLQAMIQSAVSEIQAEVTGLRAEIAGLQDKLAHGDKPKKGRQQPNTA